MSIRTVKVGGVDDPIWDEPVSPVPHRRHSGHPFRTAFAGLLVAEQGGQVVGYSQFGRDREEAGRGEIFGFYLHPAAWGHGAATELMAASLRDLGARGLDPVVVWTHPGAMRAHAFYVRSGFRATGRSRTETLGSEIDAPEVEFVRVGDT
jgi:RimJ/RimL family protein N-acetyltransferase